jgi:hypothetical protein
MHNLAVNLANQQFRDQHSLLLEQYRTLLSKTPTDPQQTSSASHHQTGSPNAPPSHAYITSLKDDYARSNGNPSFLDMNSSYPGNSQQNRLDTHQDDSDYSSDDEEPQIDEDEC